MSFKTWIAFVLLETLLCFTPGPAVLTVFASAVDGGWRGGIASTFGILAGNGIYFVLSAAGLGAILLAWPGVFAALQWVGAAYLVWMGLAMVFRGPRLEGDSEGAVRGVGRRSFARALTVQVTNPKALVFFGALLPQFIDPGRSPVLQLWILGLTGGIVELAVLAIYTGAAVKGRRRFPGGGAALLARRFAGAWLALIGVLLAVARLR